MHYIVYKITCLVNWKFYIGVHATDCIDDGYMGSGINITRAIKQLGIESFVKEILFDFDTAKKAFDKEAELVTKELVKSELCYNIAPGGGGANLRLYDDHFKYIFKPNEQEVDNWIESTERLVTIHKGTKFSEIQGNLIPETKVIWAVLCNSLTVLYNINSSNKRAKRILSVIERKNLNSCLFVAKVEWPKTA